MNQGNILKDLRDIHYPDSVSWWPPAIGWQLLALLLGIAVAAIAYYCYRRYQKNKQRKYILKEIDTLKKQCELDQHNAHVMAELSILVKRLVMTFYPRDVIAGLSGSAWLRFLDQISASQNFTHGPGRLLIDGPYAGRANKKALQVIHLVEELAVRLCSA